MRVARRPQYPALGPEGLAAALDALERGTRLPEEASREEVLAAYSELFQRAFDNLATMVGSKGAQAITQRAIKVASVRSPALADVVASESRVMLDGGRVRTASPEQLRDAVDDLFLTTMDVLASLIGAELLSALLGRITSAGADATQ